MAFTPPGVDDIEPFSPPAPDEFDLSQVKASPAELASLSQGPQESYGAVVPPSMSPDWDFTRATHGFPIIAPLSAISTGLDKAIDPILQQVMSGMKTAEAPETSLMTGTLDTAPVQPNVPAVTFPRLSPAQMEGATPGERVAAGIGEGIASTAESFLTPKSLALLPLAETKPIQALFGAQMLASIPPSIEAAASAKTPEEKARAYTSLGLNLGMTGLMAHAATREGAPNASRITSPESIPQLEVRPQVGEKAPLRQQGETAPAREEEKAPVGQEEQVPLSEEHARLLAPHWTDNHVFGKLGPGRVAMADHATGKVIVDPWQFAAFVENDLKGLNPKQKAAAVRTMFDEEDIHLKTPPEDADKYEATLSPFEKRIFTRNYMRGSTEPLSPRNLGFEVIRKRIQQARGMTPTEFIGLTMKERWTAKSLDALAEIVGKIRRLKDRELNANQKAILDKVLDNIGAARNAVAPTKKKEEEYVPGPFSRRTMEPEEPKEGMARLYRGHDGASGGVYWTKDRGYAERMGPKLEYLDVPKDQLADYSLRKVEGSGTPNAFKLPPEMTKGAQSLGEHEIPVHDLGPASRRRTAEEVFDMSDEEAHKYFTTSARTQRDGVLYGMELTPNAVPRLQALRDQAGKKMLEATEKGDGKAMQIWMGKAIWMNGAIEGALNKGPNYTRVMAEKAEAGPAARRKPDEKELNRIEEVAKNVKYLDQKLSEAVNSGDLTTVNNLSSLLNVSKESLLYYVTHRQHSEGEPGVGPGLGPAARRKQGKPGEQEEMFGPVTAKGVPGAESVPIEQRTAPQGAFVSKNAPQVTTPEKIDWQEESKSRTSKQSLPFRVITPSEAKSPTALKNFLTEDARTEGSDLPVSATKRLTALFDTHTGQVHLVSTYRGDNVARMVDPALAGSSRPNRPVSELLHRYTPIYSILLKEPVQNFHEAFNSMADFREGFVNEANRMARERGTGTPGIPMTEMESATQQPTPFQAKQQREPNLPRPTEEELRAFHDFFGDEPPSDALMFSRKIENAAANASRTMINGIRKLVRMERAQTRGLSEGEAIGRVLDRLYENLKNSETRSEFVGRTMEQSRLGAPEEIPAGGPPRETGARELSTLRSKAPTAVPGIAPGSGGPLPEPWAPPKPSEMLSPEEQAALEAELRKQHPPRFVASPQTTLGRQLLERQVPKEPYTVGATKSIQEGPPKLDPLDETLEQPDIFPERELMSEVPGEEVSEEGKELVTKAAREKPGRTKTESGVTEALEKAESSKRQLDFWKNQGPAARRKMEDTVGKLREYLGRTSQNISSAGNLSDQLYRLKTSEKADYDLALPVIRSAIRTIPESDRPALLRYADEMQVMKKSGVKLTDAQQMMYDTFLKPLIDQNRKIYETLVKNGVDVGESTYLGRLVQDTHSLYSRLWRGTKRRVAEGALLGQSASFFKRRVFKALEDEKGNRQLVAVVGSGKNTRVVAYEKGKASLMGKMPPESMEVKPLTAKQQRLQRVVEARRLRELDKLDKEEQALLKERDRLEKSPQSPDRDLRLKGVDDRLSSINGDYAEIEQTYPNPVFETPRYWRDNAGKLWRFTDATVSEIESHTDTRYYKEPMSGIITQNLKLKQIYRAAKFLEDLRNSADFQRVSRSINDRNTPPDWRLVDLPQLRGLRIEPRTADVLDLFAEEQRGPSVPLQYLNAVNSFLRNSLFIWNPFVHEPNLLNHWFTARGIEWAKPGGYQRMFKTGVAALNDVLTRSQFRDQALRAGAPLMRGMGNINRELLKLLQGELDANPSLGRRVARALGYINPFRAVRAFGDSLTWGTNEILTLQLIRETMDRTNLGLEDAINEVGKHMPNYRIPPRVLNSRLISHVMRNPMVSLWGHYRYGAIRSYGEMAKEIFSPSSTPGERVEGLGRVATIGFLMAVAYPVIDHIIQSLTGNQNYHLRRAGSATVPSNLLQLYRGKKTPEAVLQAVVTPSPLLTAGPELFYNRNLRTGLPIYERRLGMQTGKDLLNFAAQQISPVEEATRVVGGKKSLEEFGLGLAGISQSRVDSAMSKFGREADLWMKNNPDESIREQYKRRTQDVFQESNYQDLRSAVIRKDDRSAQIAVDRLLKTRGPDEIYQRIQAWKNSPFTGTRKTDQAFMAEMTPAQWDLWYESAQERLDIADRMTIYLVRAAAEKK